MDWQDPINFNIGQIPVGSSTVELLGWAHEAKFPDNRVHRHAHFEVCLVGAYGEGEFVVEGTSHVIRTGSLFVARPGIDHQIINTGKVAMELYWLSFQLWPNGAPLSSNQIDLLLASFATSPILVANCGGDGVTSLWKTIQTILDGPRIVGHTVQMAGLATALIIAIAQKAATIAAIDVDRSVSGHSKASAMLAVRFIQDNLNLPLNVEEIAAQVHLSPRHLTRLVTEFAGLPPAKLLNAARLDRADNLLKSTSTPIKEIATSVGYPDVHHFTRAYSARFGCGPGESRRRR